MTSSTQIVLPAESIYMMKKSGILEQTRLTVTPIARFLSSSAKDLSCDFTAVSL